ncbi:MAG: hypothetical protein U9Q80_05780 [Bacillota bacterium]|nr:hypothetical protein [Bacillota bacterium]
MLVKKESLILLGIILLLVMSSISSFADFQQTTDVSGVQPKFTHIFLLSTATKISNGTATISTSFQTYDTDSVELEITLQKYVSGH